MRKLLPDLRTLPSSTCATLSAFAIVATSTSLPLNENDEVRAITRNCGICANWFNSSSDKPSEKYSCSLSELMLTKGRTAMDFEVTEADNSLGAPPRRGPSTNLSKAK